MFEKESERDGRDFTTSSETYASPVESRGRAEDRPSDAGRSRTPRVLVVDDYADTRAILIDVLVNHGFRVETAEEGAEALEKIRTWRPDIAILDLAMPGLDGFDVARRLKADTTTRDLPIVAYTAHTDPEYRTRAEAVGFAALMVKPTSPAEIVSRLRVLLPDAARPVTHGHEPDPDDTWTRLAGVRQAYESALPLRVRRLARSWQDLRTAQEVDGVRLEALRFELHRLKASGTTYGFPEVSRSAGKLEEALADWREKPTAGTRTAVDRLMDELRQAAARWGGSP